MSKNGTLENYPKATQKVNTNPQDFLTKFSADCMIPAATEKSIHAGNADDVKVKAIFEGANGPITFKAHEILEKKGIIATPDMLVNGGGVTYSYFE